MKFSHALVALIAKAQLVGAHRDTRVLEQAEIIYSSCGEGSTENLPSGVMHDNLGF
jgi:hypothetical protein